MTELSLEQTSTWTAYPSLLSSLLEAEQRTALEDAACAHYCGRYQDAEVIFNSKLSDFRTKPIFTLQRADMLTSQGREHERIQQLKLAFEDSAVNEEAAKSVQLLLKFMLADAEFWALGQPKAVLGLLPAVRSRIRSHGMDNLSDVEIRCITLYHSIVDAIEQCSKYIGKEYKTIFLDSRGSRALELKHLRQVLQTQQRWRLASNVMQLELKYTSPGDALQDAVQDAFRLCASMETYALSLEMYARSPLIFRASVLKKRLAEILCNLKSPFFSQTKNEYLKMLKEISPPSYSDWEEFCPVIAFDKKTAEILRSDASYSEKIDKIHHLVKDADRTCDYTKVNQAYMAMRDMEKQWLEAVQGTSEESSTLVDFRAVGKAFWEFQDQRAKVAYFTGAALTDYLNTLSVKFHDYSTVLELMETFEEKHTSFSIPNNQERLYAQAITAARHLGMIEKERQLAKKYKSWFLKCSFVGQGGEISDEAISNPDFAFREINGDSNDPVEWGTNAVKLMMRWAGHEWDQDLMSIEDCSRLFGPSLGVLPQANLAEYLRDVPATNVSEHIFGNHDTPAPTITFLARYRKLLDWIMIPDRLPSRPARLFALKMFLKSRLHRIREYLSEKGLPSVEEALAIEEETKALKHIENMEAVELGNKFDANDEAKLSAIQNTLVKVFAVNAVKSGLIDESELISREADCRDLITRYRNSRKSFEEYHTICQLVRLTWQRYLLFNTIPPEAIMPLVNEADRVFVATRNAITILNPAEDLIARTRLSQEFSHREHHSFALAGRLQAYEYYNDHGKMAQAQNLLSQQSYQLAFQSYFFFLHWSYRSKGRGFIDILNLEAGVARALQRIEEDSRFALDTHTEKKAIDKPEISQNTMAGFDTKSKVTSLSPPAFISPLNESMVTKQQIDIMVQTLPDGVVIVDFLDLRYSPTVSFVAIIYRKGQTNVPIPITNMSMAKIDKWVENNLNLEQEEEPGQLINGDALEKLGELSGLLEKLIYTVPKVAIQPDETVILCPTGSLNRVPIHAIPINGKPFIERNPVVYCQSLTILHWLWGKFRNREQMSKVSKATVINPMPEFWPNGNPVQSNKRVANLALKLNANLRHGYDLKSNTVSKAVENASLFNYYGHVCYNPESALDSAMILNEKAFKASKRVTKPAGCEYLTARDFFKIKLCEPALAIIIGCGSGIATISNTDDVLGIPTALFYAGATAAVSTLWSIDDDDGADFSEHFYAAIWEQKRRDHETAGTPMARDEGGGIFDHTIDLARAMQTAVIRLRGDEERKDKLAPFHWAAFTLNGFWILPDHVLPDLDTKV